MNVLSLKQFSIRVAEEKVRGIDKKLDIWISKIGQFFFRLYMFLLTLLPTELMRIKKNDN